MSIPDYNGGEVVPLETVKSLEAHQSARIAELERKLAEIEGPEPYSEEMLERRDLVMRINLRDRTIAQLRAEVEALNGKLTAAILGSQAEVERLTKANARGIELLEKASAELKLLLSERDALINSRAYVSSILGLDQDESLPDTIISIVARARDAESECDNLRTQLAEREEDRWQPIETAPKDGTHFLAGWFVDEPPVADRFTSTVAFYSQIMGNHLLSSPGKYQIGPQVSYWQPIKPPAIRAARAQEDGK